MKGFLKEVKPWGSFPSKVSYISVFSSVFHIALKNCTPSQLSGAQVDNYVKMMLKQS